MDTSIFLPESKKVFAVLGNAMVERIVVDNIVYIDYLFNDYGCSCRLIGENNSFSLHTYYIKDETNDRFMEVLEWSNTECSRLNAIISEGINETADV